MGTTLSCVWECDVALGSLLLPFHWDFSTIAKDEAPSIQGIKPLETLSRKHHNSTGPRWVVIDPMISGLNKDEPLEWCGEKSKIIERCVSSPLKEIAVMKAMWMVSRVLLPTPTNLVIIVAKVAEYFSAIRV
ncbi:hypothetical protein TWF569_005416 [Orbilia oligospora]|uniref:Uncharacterized protein n=1 Tax=Orbilia oligospora TaxID=2813651 RepID=A0A7C8JQK2_ORBOL|nr:hypothetical protein TWF103_008576 [Orbilia oligospora]KAF3101738.1 hypothetical protein TWF706_005494 [Orbilia oligospora]KAF3132061.1 hypothetical protein TWF703_007462 [Orbilia oligospora]KAF3148686.1 hypothetical protein TWF569_005416 [Orbilia oligospora]